MGFSDNFANFTPTPKSPVRRGGAERNKISKCVVQSHTHKPVVWGFTKEEKECLLFLAKKSIAAGFSNPPVRFFIAEKKLAGENLKKKAACFVTLTAGGNLRGCVGNLLAVQSLYQDVIENAKAAAFSDYRFFPLTKEEFSKIRIEISVLSELKKLEYETQEQLLEYLKKNKPGVVARKGKRAATFLPQVWEDIETQEEFLNHLCQKAGMANNEWKNGIELEIYEVFKIAENASSF